MSHTGLSPIRLDPGWSVCELANQRSESPWSTRKHHVTFNFIVLAGRKTCTGQMDSQDPSQVLTLADRIRQLNEIDKDVTKLLNAAGVAISSLSNSSSATAGQPSSEVPRVDGTLESHQAAFKAASSQYFALLSSIDVRLRRQVYALEEASIIKPDSAETAGGGGGATTFTASTSGGINPLDTSWLNSRKDTVGKDKEAELWAEASMFATQLEKEKGEYRNESGGGDEDGDGSSEEMETMDVD
ncbi:hypothetical protein PAAG_05639 [Paracoccidioides lutzii Pb01]|uniref:Mediator of RNA polymerase II transcription subunit 11 n=1 Tax=Paracoccidioides lutzii (strain ATCC MYA-826 / Pb01) TaxID=502779 RepID=C1H4E6_PARBA|nr:hypothetical protein PAAG_05639 [Paracoccidioides lutzii Pb01]EEH34590.1 hypothetical protein PAAG_05639 [Paracoccidioides lutzii Pb01]